MITYKQLSLAEIYSDCANISENTKHHFLTPLEENLNLNELIPRSFFYNYYASTGRPRDFHLTSMTIFDTSGIEAFVTFINSD